jgi:hypothetical protein
MTKKMSDAEIATVIRDIMIDSLAYAVLHDLNDFDSISWSPDDPPPERKRIEACGRHALRRKGNAYHHWRDETGVRTDELEAWCTEAVRLRVPEVFSYEEAI